MFWTNKKVLDNSEISLIALKPLQFHNLCHRFWAVTDLLQQSEGLDLECHLR